MKSRPNLFYSIINEIFAQTFRLQMHSDNGATLICDKSRLFQMRYPLKMSTKSYKKLILLKDKLKQISKLTSRKFSSELEKGSWKAVPNHEVKRFIVDSMTSVGTKKSHAISLADNLTAADYRGHYSHGLNRLGR